MPKEAFGILLDAYFLDAMITSASEMEPKPFKSSRNCKDGEKVRKVVTRGKVTWAMNTFKPNKAPGPDGI